MSEGFTAVKRTAAYCQQGGFDLNVPTPEVQEALDASIDAGIAWKAETVEELAGAIGADPATLSASVERYNELCDQGRDEDFGKDAHLMIRMEAPYYAYCAEKEIGTPMVTTSGLLVNEDSQVLDQNCNPIKGLFAAGNNSGSRFGYQYTTSISGVSLGIAQTQGYMVGKHAAEL